MEATCMSVQLMGTAWREELHMYGAVHEQSGNNSQKCINSILNTLSL